MVFTTRSVLLGLLISGLAPSAVLAEYRPDEHLVLFDCGFDDKGNSASRYFAYYSGSPWHGNNQYLPPDMLVNVPWDGSYPWRNGGVQVNTPNGDEFYVYINPSIKDIGEPPHDYAGVAAHKYENHIFDCYGMHDRDVFWLGDGTSCGSAYVCFHEKDGDDNGGGDGGDNGGGTSYEKSSLLSLNPDTVEVTDSKSSINDNFAVLDPRDAFKGVWDVIQGNMCRDTKIKISDSCHLWFECKITGNGDPGTKTNADALANFIEKAAGGQIAKTGYEWTTYSSQWGIPTYWKRYTYPKSGQVVVSIFPTGHPDATSEHASITFHTECESSNWFCNSLCSDMASAMVAIASESKAAPAAAFGVVHSVACAAC